MPNILSVSDLRNYNEVLKNCRKGEPVYLTKNGRGSNQRRRRLAEFGRIKSICRGVNYNFQSVNALHMKKGKRFILASVRNDWCFFTPEICKTRQYAIKKRNILFLSGKKEWKKAEAFEK